MDLKILAIVQARTGSTRFPGKVLKKIKDKTLIEILFYRLSLCHRIDKIVLATTTRNEDLILANLIEKLGFDVYKGSGRNVLSRYYNAAKKYKADHIIRITGDCPLIDPKLVNDVITHYLESNVDYTSNTGPPTFPDGLDTEIFSYKALSHAYKNADTVYDKEHVTTFLKNSNIFKRSSISNEIDYSSERWTVDEPEDLEVIKRVLDYFHPKLDFSWKDILKLKTKKPEYFSFNSKIKRNEGSSLGEGQKLWKRAKKIIPGGSMLFSKRSEMFLPEKWPSYFSKSKDCFVWDLDGNKYIDMSIMGIGTNTLGYGNEEVDNAVSEIITKGNMSTFNCPEEVYLAEKLIEINPWSEMVRFARTGGEANSIAIRIARAASGKDNIAICGYHGWHDWYLSSNLKNRRNLDTHLLPGLESKGVPNALIGTTVPFNYNDLDTFKKIVKYENIGAVKMEVQRSMEPIDGFLESIRKICDENNIILIFDECTSGFRETYGGLHKKYKISPDMAIFGKALGNGYAITAVVGKKEYMEAAQETFISSTFWTERIGPAAALKTLEVMKREKSWKKITKIGKKIGDKWKELADKHNIPINIFGIPAIIKFNIKSEKALEYKTLITQEMLKKGFLAANSVYVCTHHSNVLEEYFHSLDKVFSLISKCEDGYDVNKLLESQICHSEFQRLS